MSTVNSLLIFPSKLLRAFAHLTCLGLLAACHVSAPTDYWDVYEKGIEALYVLGVAAHKTDPENIVILTPDGVFKRNTDGSWRSSSSGIGEERYSTWGHLVGNSIWQGHLHEDQLFTIIAGRLYESRDFGETWVNKSGNGKGSTKVYSDTAKECFDQLAGIVQDPNNPEVIYAGTINSGGDGGLFLTRNGGEQWVRVSGDFSNASDCDAHGRSTNKAYYYVSEYENEDEIRGLRNDYSVKGTRLEENSKSEKTVYCSPNSGFGNDAWPLAFGFGEIGTSAGMAVAGSPHEGNFGPQDGFKRSDDGGRTWIKFSSPELCRLNIRSIVFSPGKDVWFASSHEQILTSEDGQDWSVVHKGGFVDQVVIDNNGGVWALGDGSIWKWMTAQERFEPIAKAPRTAFGLLIIQAFDEDPEFLVTTKAQGLWRYRNGRWQDLTQGLDGANSPSNMLQTSSDNRLFLHVDYQGFYSRNELSHKWRKVGPDMNTLPYAKTIAPNGRRIYWVDGDNRVFGWQRGEADWSEISFDQLEVGRLEQIRVNPWNPNVIHALVKQGSSRKLARLKLEGNHLILESEHVLKQLKYRGLGFRFNINDANEIFFYSYVTSNGAEDKFSGLWRSQDGGSTFEPVLLAQAEGALRALEPVVPVSSEDAFYGILWGTNDEITWNATLGRLDFEKGTLEPISTAVDGLEGGWPWLFDIRSSSPLNLVAADWRAHSPIRILCANGTLVNPEWQHVAAAGLSAVDDVIDLRLLPWDPDTAVVTLDWGGVYARRVYSDLDETAACSRAAE